MVVTPSFLLLLVCVQRCVCSGVCACVCVWFYLARARTSSLAGSGIGGFGFVQRIQNIQGVEALRVARGSQQNSTTKDHSMHSSSKEDGTRARRSSRLNSLAPAKQANEDVHDLYIHNHPSRRRRSVRGPRCHAPICRENNKLFLLSKRWSTPLAWWRGAGPSVRPSARCARR